jgi:hypothetical protein
MTDTTQTQVTGPVDDAIDADDPIEVLAYDLQSTLGYQGLDGESFDWVQLITDLRDARYAIVDTRLAPRADALIEREQVEAAMDHTPLVEVDPEFRKCVVDAFMALLPRAPMPDVVTMSRVDWAIVKSILLDHRDNCGEDWENQTIINQIVASLFDAEVGS